MVLRAAKFGGLSRFCSSTSIHDEIARTRPDLLDALYQPFPMSWKGQEAPGAPGWHLQPMFAKEQGKLSSRFIPQHIIGYSVDAALLRSISAARGATRSRAIRRTSSWI